MGRTLKAITTRCRGENEDRRKSSQRGEEEEVTSAINNLKK